MENGMKSPMRTLRSSVELPSAGHEMVQLFRIHPEDERHLDVEPKLPAGPLAIGWVAASLTWRLPEPYLLTRFLAPLLLVPVQRHVNHINALVVPDHNKNTRFSGWN